MKAKEKLVVFGAGGHAKVVLDIIEQQGVYVIAGLFDDDIKHQGKRFFGYPVLGTRAELPALLSAELRHAVVTIGDNASRAAVAAFMEQLGWVFASAVHPRASISRGAEVGPGSVVMAGCVINADTYVGRQVIINTGATVDHDCRVEDAVHIAPGCHLCGGVSVGPGSFLGAGSAVTPGVRIGAGAIIGAGSTVIRDVADGAEGLRFTGEAPGLNIGPGAKPLDSVQRLALEGGTPVRTEPFAPWPEFAEDEIAAVAEVLRSGKVNYWTGEQSQQFEREFAKFIGVKYAVALANGTVALELALHALGVVPGDEVVVPCKTFIASASCVVRLGATPVVADIDPDSQNITAASIAAVLTERTKAVIVVHLAGWPCEMDGILALARERALSVVEDCAQCAGARYKGRTTGSIGDIGAFSFCQDKIITTGGEGGMLVTDRRELWEKAWSYKDHGKSYAAVFEREHPFGFRWLHESFGSNGRITEMQSAIGRLQLAKLPQWLALRRRNAALLSRGLASIPGIRLALPPVHSEPAYYKYYAFIRPEMLRPGWNLERILEALNAEGIPCTVGACSEIYLEQAFVHAGLAPEERLQVAQRLADASLLFLLHPGLTEQDMRDTCTAVAKVLRSDRLDMHIRNWMALVHDVAAAALAWYLAYWLRFNTEIPAYNVPCNMVAAMLWVVPLQALVFFIAGMYRGMWRYASVPDLQRIAIAVVVSILAIALMLVMLPPQQPPVPRSVMLMDPILLIMLLGGSRLAYRAWKERRVRSVLRGHEKLAVILGAGDAAADLLKNLSRAGDWRVLGLLDDNPAKRGRQIQGVTVLGPLEDLVELVPRLDLERAIIAMPSASHQSRRRALEICRRAGVEALTVPSYQDLVGGKVTVSQVRKVELDDLLGRDPVALDESHLKAWVRGRSILITGAGGSIGSELCRQLARFEPERLVLYEQNEFALYRMEQEFALQHPEIGLECVIGDVKNAARVAEALSAHRPQIVFHAAAYKHVPLMEEGNAWEAIQNNVLGTWRVAEAAIALGVEKFVMVSTDKAVNPTNAMGASKRLAEIVCQGLQAKNPTRFVIVRFGNVLGSTGSVIPKFREQIARGGPVTVTHPEITRYFMSIPEAAQLVLQAGLMGAGGEIFVLDMGEPVKIVDLARELIRLSGYGERDISIEFTGLRPGEKLYEELLADDELTQATPHPKLRIAQSRPAADAAWMQELYDWLQQGKTGADEVRRELAVRVPEYTPQAILPAAIPEKPAAPQPG